jgi:hypothetical protein
MGIRSHRPSPEAVQALTESGYSSEIALWEVEIHLVISETSVSEEYSRDLWVMNPIRYHWLTDLPSARDIFMTC